VSWPTRDACITQMLSVALWLHVTLIFHGTHFRAFVLRKWKRKKADKEEVSYVKYNRGGSERKADKLLP
jgi:hypothetical protein